jgi:nicotinamidase-related amidase
MTSKDLALIIVDPQNDFCEGGGSLPIPNSNAIFPLIN